MRIERFRSNRTFGRRRRSGCISWTFVSGILFGVVIAALAWLGGWLGIGGGQQINRDLSSARQAFARGDLDTVIERAQRIWEADPEHAEALTLLVRALIYRSYADYDHEPDRARALDLTTEAYRRLPADYDVIAAHAFALQANGFSQQAERLVTYVLSRSPRHVLARITLGLAYGGLGIYQGALEAHQAVIDPGALWLDAQRALALSLGDLGRYDEAINVVDTAIDANAHMLMLYFERAEYALHNGDVDTATASYFRVLAFDPDNVKARLRLCTLSTSLRESDTALRYCQEVVNLAPQWVDGWYHLGKEYFVEGDFAAAQQVFHQCTTLSVDQHIPVADRQFECWYLQGQAAEFTGDCEALLAVYNEFQSMAQSVSIPQTWTYPPEGPAICNPS